MTTATVEDTLAEPLAIVHQIDAAIRRKAARQQTADDAIILSLHGIDGAEFDQHVQRLKGVDHRKGIAGTPEEFTSAEKRADVAEQALFDGKDRLQPKIDKLKAELQRHEADLLKLRDEDRAAADDLAKRQNSRRMLGSTLLPPLLKQLVEIEERPVRQKYAPLIAAARQKAAQIGGQVRAGLARADVSQEVDAVDQIQQLEKQLQAELLTVGLQFRDFYFSH